jgi:hypothetical protein
MTKRVSFGNVWHQVSNSMLIAVETHVGRDTIPRHAILADLDGLVHAEAGSKQTSFEHGRVRELWDL